MASTYHGYGKLKMLQASCQHEEEIGPVRVTEESVTTVVCLQQFLVTGQYMQVTLQLTLVQTQAQPRPTWRTPTT